MPLADLEADRAWVEANLDEARSALQDAKAALPMPNDDRNLAETKLLSDTVFLQQFRIVGSQQHLDLLAEVQVIRDDLQQLRLDEQSGIVLGDPPHDIEHAIEAWRAQRQYENEIQAVALRAGILARNKENALASLERSETEYHQILERLEAVRDDGDRRLLRAELTHNRATHTFAEERYTYFRAQDMAFAEQTTRNEIRSRLLAQRLARILDDVTLREDALKARRDATTKELEAVQHRLAGIAARKAAHGEVLEAVRTRAGSLAALGEDDGSVAGELRIHQEREKVLQTTIEETDAIYVAWLNLELQFWEERFNLDTEPDRAGQAALQASVESSLANAGDSVRLIELSLRELSYDPVISIPSSESGTEAYKALEADLAQRAELLTDSLAAVTRVMEFLQVLHMEAESRRAQSSIVERGRKGFVSLRDSVKRVWDYELFAIDDQILVDGETIVEKRPVTIGKVILAMLILAIGLLVASLVGRLSNLLMSPLARTRWSGRLILEKLIRMSAVVFAVTVALIMVKIPLTVFAFFGGALAIGVGFGAQTLINNFISGFILLAERPIQPGDTIEVDGVRGKVEVIGERCTRVRRFDGIEILIPNSQLLEQSVTNITHSDQQMRTSIDVGVAYGSPTRKVQALLLQIVKEHPLILEDPSPVALFRDLGESALKFSVYFWVDLQAQPDWRVIVSEILHAICERTAAEGIAIAFPQHDVHLDAARPIPVELVRKPSKDASED